MNDQVKSFQTAKPKASRAGWHPRQWWREVRLALGFFTRLPLKSPAGQVGEAARAFPVAGAVVGLIGSAIYLLAAEIGLSGLLAALLAVAATVVAGGALHEDGLADFADMLGVRGDRERKLAVMRDSRIGSYGVLALGFSIAIKVGALVGLGDPPGDPWHVAGALITANVCGRAVLPMVMRSLPLARANGLAVEAGKPTAPATYQGLGIALLISGFACGPGAALVSVVVAIVAAFLVSEIARRQIGGYTGDVLGAAQDVAQLAVLINIAALT